ncbi:peptidase M18, aminopeptidase I [Alkaliphilus metalliredigens QYMF]|uniref:M18 family aminopeptidase n=1 Tax=Alkaliphilus metalliredigens (strain QYMF) TaxID=293826 RepID=A6TSW1_ALKMQ|nr:aminopeptidase [Alkaliphilus metalliredigens]ABR49279.1 peptidase M18, aminopeptidase I [Alkaliphilus metalliredigens QYMF]
MAERISGKKRQEQLTKMSYNAWEQLADGELERVFEFGEIYKKFMDQGKTERECVDEIIAQARERGFVSLDEVMGRGIVKPGDRIYAENKGKAVALFVIGNEGLEKGMRIIGSHLDAPRLDLKAVPLYEEGGLALLKTHYYGGVKKYHWVATPLALHGVLIKKNGEKLSIVIGEDDQDPVFYISDLLPHLAKDQMAKKMGEGITGEELNVIIGNIPYQGDDIDEKVKLNILDLLNEKYGIDEEDFTVAEIEIVPAGKSRDVGLDRSMIAAHGHDDRVCSFAACQAVLEISNPKDTIVGLFVDKEEVGSMGNTGMESMFFENVVAELLNLEGTTSYLGLRRSMSNSKVLSGDVTAGFDPNFPDVLDKRNASFIGKGVTLTKYTGVKGKSGSNDANAEFLSEVRSIFNSSDVTWQVGELGKVDQGGGGTIAYILANYGAEVVDCGTPMLSMHAPIELISKVDLYMTYKAYKAFYQGITRI